MGEWHAMTKAYTIDQLKHLITENYDTIGMQEEALSFMYTRKKA